LNNSLQNAKDLWGALQYWWDTDYDITIKGKIVDVQGLPIQNAIVVIGNTSTLSAADGHFEIADWSGTKMEVRKAGYQSKRLNVDEKSSYVIMLDKFLKKEERIATGKKIDSIRKGTFKELASFGYINLTTIDSTRMLNGSIVFDAYDKDVEIRRALRTFPGHPNITRDMICNKMNGADIPPPPVKKVEMIKYTPPKLVDDGENQVKLNYTASAMGATYNYAVSPTAVAFLRFTPGTFTTNFSATSNNESSNGAIEVKQISSNKPFIKSLKETDSTKRYEKYLVLRKGFLHTPSFYLEVAHFFFQQNQKELGLLVLSNIADMNLEDHELYKMLGYELKMQGEYKEAVNVFKKVLQWRPQEPQSYRDYGLALADAGQYQNAVDTLYAAITKNYDSDLSSNYNGIEEVMVTEINNIITLQKNINTDKIEGSLVSEIPVDVRVVLNWNMNDTDMDLWVIDPREEKCFYSNKVTKIGGRISDDFISGYGPEQFMLKKATKGTYKVMLHYYGDGVQKIAGGSTVMAEIYTNYGRPNQERKLITMQMEKDEDRGGILVGEFRF
jgi:tetratricopeptide (TPR) repeat protein